MDSRKASKVFSKEDFSSTNLSWYGVYEAILVRLLIVRLGELYPTDSVKSGNDCPILIHNTEIGVYIDLDKTNLAYLVVRDVMSG